MLDLPVIHKEIQLLENKAKKAIFTMKIQQNSCSAIGILPNDKIQ